MPVFFWGGGLGPFSELNIPKYTKIFGHLVIFTKHDDCSLWSLRGFASLVKAVVTPWGGVWVCFLEFSCWGEEEYAFLLQFIPLGYINFEIKLLEASFPFSTQCLGSCIHQELMDQGFPTEYFTETVTLELISALRFLILFCLVKHAKCPPAFPGEILGEKPCLRQAWLLFLKLL